LVLISETERDYSVRAVFITLKFPTHLISFFHRHNGIGCVLSNKIRPVQNASVIA